MPIYAYHCSQCRYAYERREGFDAPSEHACPQCGGTARRRIVVPAIVFKGSGFYSTDNRRSGGWNADNGHKSSEDAETPSDLSAPSSQSHDHDHADHDHSDSDL